MSLVGQPIRVDYQPAGASAGLTVKMEILDETGYTDIVNYPIVQLTELLLSGGSIYRTEFTPDAPGVWETRVYVEGRTESMIKQWIVEDIDLKQIVGAPPTIA